MELEQVRTNYNVIDPQRQIVATLLDKQTAQEFLDTLQVPYKEFYRIEKQKVYKKREE